MARSLFLILFLFSFEPSLKAEYLNNKCEDFNIEVVSMDATEGNNGEIKLIIPDQIELREINIFGEGQKNNRLKASKEEKKLPSGNYIIIVEYDKGCKKMLKALIN